MSLLSAFGRKTGSKANAVMMIYAVISSCIRFLLLVVCRTQTYSLKRLYIGRRPACRGGLRSVERSRFPVHATFAHLPPFPSE